MKKTVKINIGGLLFHVDEDAFVILNAYLGKIKSHFKTDREGSEIIADIENRIAELLQLRINDQKQVIILDDVNEMIEIMGRPEDFEGEPEAQKTYDEPLNRKRFYRDLDSNVIGGVCSGLGAYFGIDPVILRVLFVILSFAMAGFPVAVYLVLWIVTPAALTTAQKMEMRGGDFTINDIEQRVKTEFDNVKGNFKKMRDSDGYRRGRNSMNTVGNGFVEVLNFFGRFILIIIGVVFIITGLSLIASLFGFFVFSDSFLFWTHTDQHHILIPDFLFSIVHPKSILLATVCIIIIVSAPVIAIIYWGLKLVLRFRANDKVISVVATVAWVLSIIILAGISLFEVKEYAFSTQLDDSIEMNLPNEQTLYIRSSTDMDDFSEVYFFEEGLDVYTHEFYPDRVYLEPDLKIKYTSDNEVSIKFEKEARGATNKLARENASNIEFNWHLKDSVLYIDPLFYHNNKDRWTFPELDIVLYLPEGQKICVDKNLEQTLSYVKTADDIWESEIPGKCWVMTDYGLDHP
ncbi:MAG: PspC domain-containing protein [Salinivirgaceae bacterium]|jgi:phage shock protein PspC (stress-responsive transcriptional regulator)|nr:PspC domain-containing protein [Salinivirgaceae bacterium]